MSLFSGSLNSDYLLGQREIIRDKGVAKVINNVAAHITRGLM